MIEQKLQDMNLRLPLPPAKGGVYTPVREFGGLFVYSSGFGPVTSDKTPPNGKLGRDLTLEEGQEAARLCTLNLLAALKAQIGDFSRVKRFVKLLVFVSSDDSFYEQPQVANGASQLIADLFGEEIGMPARSAIGVNVLPGNIAVEVEALIELHPSSP